MNEKSKYKDVELCIFMNDVQWTIFTFYILYCLTNCCASIEKKHDVRTQMLTHLRRLSNKYLLSNVLSCILGHYNVNDRIGNVYR